MKKIRNKERAYSKRYAAVVLSIISAVFCALTVIGIWVFRKYLSDAELVRGWVEENYILGAIAIILVCAVQVVVALIPGEAVEIACGYVFGAWGGCQRLYLLYSHRLSVFLYREFFGCSSGADLLCNASLLPPRVGRA